MPDDECVVDPVLRVQAGDLLLYVPRAYNSPSLSGDAPMNRKRQVCQAPDDPPIEAGKSLAFFAERSTLDNALTADYSFLLVALRIRDSGEPARESWARSSAWKSLEILAPDEGVEPTSAWIRSLEKEDGVPTYTAQNTVFYFDESVNRQTPSGEPLAWKCGSGGSSQVRRCESSYSWTERTKISYRFYLNDLPVSALGAMDDAVRAFWRDMQADAL